VPLRVRSATRYCQMMSRPSTVAPPARVLHGLLAGDVDFALMDVQPHSDRLWFAHRSVSDLIRC